METMIIMGIECAHSPETAERRESWSSLYGSPLSIGVVRYRDDGYSLSVEHEVSHRAGEHRATARVFVWDQPSIEAAERAWLEAASLEAPRLCALVVDHLQARAAEVRGAA